MNKERIKSVILALLVIVNLMLAEKILVNKKLWPSGYNFFNMRNTVKKNDYSVTGHLAVPEKIIINTGYQSSRFEYLRNSKDFAGIFSSASDVLKKAFQSPLKAVTTVTSDSWYSALTAKSIYLSYPCRYSAPIFASLSGLSSTELNLESFQDIVISENGNVYISDKNGTVFYKIDVFADSISPIIKAVADEHSDEESVINYSFDLNFDKNLGEQKTILSPMIPVYSGPVLAEAILSFNPAIKDGEFNHKIISNILTAFSINPNTLRRHTEADGSMVFVENNGILKISPDGVLTFTATGTGINLSGTVTYDTGSNLSKIAEFIDNVNAAIGTDIDMCVTSPLVSNDESNFTFDYIANGLPVKFSDKSAVTATVKDGYIKEYTQILRRYIGLGIIQETPLYIESLDAIIAQYQTSMNEISITKMLPAYLDDLTIGQKSPDWFIGIDNVVAQ